MGEVAERGISERGDVASSGLPVSVSVLSPSAFASLVTGDDEEEQAGLEAGRTEEERTEDGEME